MIELPESSTESTARPGPEPEPEAQALSERLCERIRREILDAGGFLPFSRYMDLALYAPGLGYYMNGLRKFGPGGDFITAPEVSSLFGATLAQWLAPALAQWQARTVPDADPALAAGCEILEFGAGSGRLAADVITRLDELGVPLTRYRILELSPDLRARQQALLAKRLGSERLLQVEWLDALPEAPIHGVVLANEVLDAMPVEVFAWRDGRVWQRGAGLEAGHIVFAERPAPPELEQQVRALEQACGPWPEGYLSEWRPMLQPWVQTVAECLAQGLIWIGDYGHPRAAFYSPERTTGTLLGYYRQQMVFDPFAWPGLMDLTGSVDFTAVAEAAEAAELDVLSYAAQGEFLLGAGLPGLFEQAVGADPEPRHTLELAQQVRWLTLPGEMGERFQVMVLGRDCPLPSNGTFPDRRERL